MVTVEQWSRKLESWPRASSPIVPNRLEKNFLDNPIYVCIIYRLMKRVNYHLTEAEITRLQALSKKTGLSVAEIIRRAIDEYLDRKERKNMKKEETKK
jgi:predicted DNA-binding protein